MEIITRRDFLKASGALVVSVAFPGTAGIALSQGVCGQAAAYARPARFLDRGAARTAASRPSSARWTWARVSTSRSRRSSRKSSTSPSSASPSSWATRLSPATRAAPRAAPASQRGGMTLRNAAAEARRLLVERAAKKLALHAGRASSSNNGVVDGARLRAAAGVLRRADRWQALPSQARVEQGIRQHARHQGPGEAESPVAAYKVVGKSFPRKIATAKIMGRGPIRHRCQGAKACCTRA